jgi:hypothetical protein
MENVSVTGTGDDEVQGYCFRCRMRKPMHAATETRMRNGKLAYTGTCVTCGTRMFKIAPLERPVVLASLHGEANRVL